MDCTAAEKLLLAMEDPAREIAADPVLAAHVKDCATCQELLARLGRLQLATNHLPERASEPSPAFLVQVIAGVGDSVARRRRIWFSRSLAAALVVVIGLLALTLCVFNGQSARANSAAVIADLSAWNLEIAAAHEPAERLAIYRRRVDEMTRRIAGLSGNDRAVAQAMLDSADQQAADNNPLKSAQRLAAIADQVQSLKRSGGGALPQGLDDAYRNLSQGIRVQLRAVDANTLSPEDRETLQTLQERAAQQGAFLNSPARGQLSAVGAFSTVPVPPAPRKAAYTGSIPSPLSSAMNPVVAERVPSQPPAHQLAGHVPAPSGRNDAADPNTPPTHTLDDIWELSTARTLARLGLGKPPFVHTPEHNDSADMPIMNITPPAGTPFGPVNTDHRSLPTGPDDDAGSAVAGKTLPPHGFVLHGSDPFLDPVEDRIPLPYLTGAITEKENGSSPELQAAWEPDMDIFIPGAFGDREFTAGTTHVGAAMNDQPPQLFFAFGPPARTTEPATQLIILACVVALLLRRPAVANQR